MATRQTNWRALINQVDPEFNYKSRIVPEYEFTSLGIRSQASNQGMAHDRSNTFDHGLRVFMGDYKTRGPYSS